MYGRDPRAAAGVRDGEILAGKYRVQRVLGVGGMGVVVAATHLQLKITVAIKFLLHTMLDQPGVVRRFADEAQRAAQITSEHVVRVYDVGTLENGAPYMVMEYLEGSDLSALLRQRGPLPVKDAIDFVLQAMEAVAEAHTKGIVHRELKPANLFCVRRSDGKLAVKVLDFGISKTIARGAASGNLSITATHSLMGSPFYMSPGCATTGPTSPMGCKPSYRPVWRKTARAAIGASASWPWLSCRLVPSEPRPWSRRSPTSSRHPRCRGPCGSNSADEICAFNCGCNAVTDCPPPNTQCVNNQCLP